MTYPFAIVIGDCRIGKLVLVAPLGVYRSDEGFPIHIGDYSNMQDGVILHALETTSHGKTRR
jgi:carbon dioxide concentrating mechanism protein CcmM